MARATVPINLLSPPAPGGTSPIASLALVLLIALAVIGPALLILPRVLP